MGIKKPVDAGEGRRRGKGTPYYPLVYMSLDGYRMDLRYVLKTDKKTADIPMYAQ